MSGLQRRSGHSGGEEKNSHRFHCREMNLGRPARSLVTILTELPRPYFNEGTCILHRTSPAYFVQHYRAHIYCKYLLPSLGTCCAHSYWGGASHAISTTQNQESTMGCVAALVGKQEMHTMSSIRFNTLEP
jgi:hypothetical protein